MYQLKLLRTAVMFYTRIPVGVIKGYSNDMASRSVSYFPLVGGIIGLLCAGVFYAFSLVLPQNVSILLSMAFSVYLTGAFHEDGFADFCDGFGGGYTKDRVMEIMKDSRIGAYGSVGIIFMLAIKFFSLAELSQMQVVYALVAGHVLSRMVTAVLSFTAKYVQSVEKSKLKAELSVSKFQGMIFPVMVGLVPVIWLGWQTVAFFLAVSLPVFLIYRRYIIKKIGGYTGDVLGAFQQITEIVFYISYIVYLGLFVG